MYGIVQVIRKSYRSTRKPQLMKTIFETQSEAEHFIMRYRQRFPYTTADFYIATINTVAEYSVQLVQKPASQLAENKGLIDG